MRAQNTSLGQGARVLRPKRLVIGVALDNLPYGAHGETRGLLPSDQRPQPVSKRCMRRAVNSLSTPIALE